MQAAKRKPGRNDVFEYHHSRHVASKRLGWHARVQPHARRISICSTRYAARVQSHAAAMVSTGTKFAALDDPTKPVAAKRK